MNIVILLAAVSAVAGLGVASSAWSSAWADDKRMGDQEIAASATPKKSAPTR